VVCSRVNFTFTFISVSEHAASKVESLLSGKRHSVLQTTIETLTLYSPGICLEELSKATTDSVQTVYMQKPEPGAFPTKLHGLTATLKCPTAFNSHHRAHTVLNLLAPEFGI
jgi:hypothetical protein